jgi:hypothetical protein
VGEAHVALEVEDDVGERTGVDLAVEFGCEVGRV